MNEETFPGDAFDTGDPTRDSKEKEDLLKSYPFRFVTDQGAWIAAVSIVLADEEIKAAPSSNHLRGLIRDKVLRAFDK